MRSRGTGNYYYTVPNTAGGVDGAAAPLPDNINMRDTYNDSFISSNSTALINGYVDLPVNHRFTPYIGAGIGFVRHQLKGRSYSRVTTCLETNPDCDPNIVDAQQNSTVLNSTAATTAGGIDYAIAAALMTGFTYKVWDNTKFDIGYRWLHLGGTTFVGRSLTTVENLKIPDMNIHELRVGLRYDIN